MRDKTSRTDLERMTDTLADKIRERTIRQTTEAAEDLKNLAAGDTDPFSARLLEETLEDFSRLPDYTETLFRRRAERIIKPRRRITIIGRARQIVKFLPLPTRIKRRMKRG